MLAMMAACAGPASTPTPASPVVQTVVMPQTVVVTSAPSVTQAPQPTATTGAQTNASSPTSVAGPVTSNLPTLVRDKIKHIIVIMQENRSFDQYFGTYPGANGIPMQNGAPTVCSTDPQTKQCVKPYHNPEDVNSGGPHAAASATADIDGGKMDGFVAQFRRAQKACKRPDTPGCAAGVTPDVMGWHDAREIPNYWAYAENFVLQDAMFEPNASWSLPSHLFMVSAWSAQCTNLNDPMSCKSAIDGPSNKPHAGLSEANAGKLVYAWTDLTYLLHNANVSWAYYLSEGSEPDCADDAMLCQTKTQKVSVPGIWNPLPAFETVKQDNQLANVQTIDNYFTAAKNGTLPAVSWITPENTVSEHPPAKISAGQAYVTSLINAAMQGPDWNSTRDLPGVG